VVLSAAEAFYGCKIPVGVPVFGACQECGGTGEVFPFRCLECAGSGLVEGSSAPGTATAATVARLN
jgi:DnaJ-class molecular chaperone